MRKICVLILIAIIMGCGSKTAEKPSVIVILADGIQYEDVSVYRTDDVNKTPNLEKLARGGVCFTKGYPSSSSPVINEYALMTGLYPWKEKPHRNLSKDSIPVIAKNQLTLPKAMKHAGYVTGTVGKWHLKDTHVETVGFDFSCPKEENNESSCTDKVKEFISLHKNEPYFLYWGADNDSIKRIDTHVGELISYLEKEDLLEKTLVVFSGDYDTFTTDSTENKETRIPLFLYWKGKITPVVSDALVCQIDLMASIGRLVNADLPEGLDSHEYLDAFMGKTLKARTHIQHIQ